MTKNKEERPKFSSYYSGFWGGHAFRWLDCAKIRTLDRVMRDLPVGAKVIDLGCGSASISSLMRSRFSKLNFLGADCDVDLLSVAESKGLKTICVDFDQRLPFDDETFDVVMMIDTIEHVKSRQSALDEVMRILKETGYLIIFTPPYDTIAWNIGEKMHRILTRRMADHISPFTRESLTWCLSDRFDDVRIFNMNFGLTMCGIGNRKSDA